MRTLIRSLLLRCPRCGRGAVLAKYFQVNQRCAVCGLAFERADGEITGGMGINLVLTLLIAITAALVIGTSRTIPVLPATLTMLVVVVLFPILFYPLSRSLWIGIIYLTGDGEEGD